MTISPDDRIRMERAHVWAWPALETRLVDGWLLRCSGGGSQRANSVSTVDYMGADALQSVQHVEDWYRARGAPSRFQTFDETQPIELNQILRERGYVEAEPTITMFQANRPETGSADVTVRDEAWNDWLDIYLSAITENRREMNSRVLQNIPRDHAFFGCRRDGKIVATTLCVIHRRCAVLECVAAAMTQRRKGAAREVVNAAAHWAYQRGVDWIGLQVAANNAGAIALYQSMGFTAGAHNSFWARPTEVAS